MRLAAIDVGSNSVHLLIADVSPEGHLEVIDRVKEMVRLGRRSFTTGLLSQEAMDLAVRVLDHFQRLVEIRHVDRVRAVATSAVREANNQGQFIARIKRETGVNVEVISGHEEAQLIFRAAQYALGLEGGPHLLADLGGGSLELVLVKDRRPLWMKSAKLGAARMTERFLLDDPPTSAQCKRLETHFEKEIGEQMQAARSAGVVRVIGTSGTINTLIAMARAARGEELGMLHGSIASAAEIARLCRKTVGASAAMRMALPGIDAKRIDQVPASAMVADFVLRHSGAKEMVVCTWALREGMLLELAEATNRGAIEIRRGSVNALASRFAQHNLHGQQVAKLALKLFDAMAFMLELPESSRELLEYAALLHDIGHAIDHDRHNRHSYYLVKNADLLGFEPVEIEMIALALRAHRKQSAQLDSPEWQALSAGKRRVARGMAAILRVADALDRSHRGVVKTVAVVYSPGRVQIEIGSGREKADLELWTCERRIDLLAKLLDRQVILHN
ncbi:MAG: Ppx/GppA family phosphatase [Deltaproteobacteria bacterium]|nr:Ppx/GppA family phosphatase [Deltaproteobacteria bacterium]